MTEYFTESEARALIGKRFRATAGYSEVPPGMLGMVSGIYGGDGMGYGVDITWIGYLPLNSVGRGCGGRTDGFSKLDLEMVFTAGPHKGKRAMVPVEEKK